MGTQQFPHTSAGTNSLRHVPNSRKAYSDSCDRQRSTPDIHGLLKSGRDEAEREWDSDISWPALPGHKSIGDAAANVTPTLANDKIGEIILASGIRSLTSQPASAIEWKSL